MNYIIFKLNHGSINNVYLEYLLIKTNKCKYIFLNLKNFYSHNYLL